MDLHAVELGPDLGPELAASLGIAMGGLGLFLLAVHLISDGLKVAAGRHLREILARGTHTPLRGIAAGVLITGLVQSSSVVTVATIGFVNAGLLHLHQALGVIYGANLGTTITGWLVAVIGLDLRIEAWALPLVGLGMALRLSGQGRPRGALGQALAGFGLFFLGLGFLRQAFGDLAPLIAAESLPRPGIWQLPLFVLAGFLMTLLTQASAAAFALIITAASGGMLELLPAAAMVIGANIGTTSTAALSVIGATPNAKRVAAAHIVFNLGTGLVALLLLPSLLWLIGRLATAGDIVAGPALTLALFHTLFNLLGVVLMLPLTRPLAAFLRRRFCTTEEVESRPRHLDRAIALTPSLALDAMAMELARVATLARRMGEAALQGGADERRLRSNYHSVTSLVGALGEFMGQIDRANLAPSLAAELPVAVRAAQHLQAGATLALEIAAQRPENDRLHDATLDQALDRYRNAASALLAALDPRTPDFDLTDRNQRLKQLGTDYRVLKADLMQATTQGRITVPQLAGMLEQTNQIRRMVRQLVRGARRLSALSHGAAAQPAAALSAGPGLGR